MSENVDLQTPRVLGVALAVLTLCTACTTESSLADRTNVGKAGYGNLTVFLTGNYKGLTIDEKAVPDSVTAEARHPSIVNPYSGNAFGSETIPPYSPKVELGFPEFNFGMRYVFPFFPAFIGAEIKTPIGDCSRSDNGEAGHGYDYDVVLGQGADFVRYFYGARYRPEIVTPLAGVHLEFEAEVVRFFFDPSCKYTPGEIRYVKGIEAYADQHSRITLGKESLDTYEFNVRFGIMNNNEDEDEEESFFSVEEGYGVYLDGGYVFSEQSGVEGWTIGLGAAVGL